MRSSLWSLSAVVLLFAVGGCGSSNLPELGTVSGVVTMDGNPLPGVVVSFSPDSGGRTSSGVTDAQGKYELLYTADVEGAQVGKHTVHIASQGGAEGGGDPNAEGGSSGGPAVEPFKGTIPEIYNQKSTLTATVEAGDNTVNFDLKSSAAGAEAAKGQQQRSP